MARGNWHVEELIAFNDEVASLARVGVPLELGLTALGRDTESALGRINATVTSRISRGESLADALAAEGVSAEVIDLRTLDYTGMDYEAIGASVKKTGSVLIVEQGSRSLTLGGRISDEIQARYFDYLDCPVGHVTALDVPLPVSKKLEEAVMPSLAQITAQMARGGKHVF